MAYLGEFEQLILFSLVRLGHDAYGVRVRQEIEARTERTVSAGAVYTALGRLEDRGFVRSWLGETAPRRGGRRRKYYAVEPSGAAALEKSFHRVQTMAEGLLGDVSAIAAQESSGG